MARAKPVANTNYKPPHKKPIKRPTPPDEDPGLPAIHSTKADKMPRPSKMGSLPQFHEANHMRSPSLFEKIDEALGREVTHDEPVGRTLNAMMEMAISPVRS
jgi:hypothetical protein